MSSCLANQQEEPLDVLFGHKRPLLKALQQDGEGKPGVAVLVPDHNWIILGLV